MFAFIELNRFCIVAGATLIVTLQVALAKELNPKAELYGDDSEFPKLETVSENQGKLRHLVDK